MTKNLLRFLAVTLLCVTAAFASKASITIYVESPVVPTLYAWDDGGPINGSWPGTQMTETTEVDGHIYYFKTFEVSMVNVIFNNGKGAQTGDITGLTADTYFVYNGTTGWRYADSDPEPVETITVYYDNSSTGWTKVLAYSWGGTGGSVGWPGIEMTFVRDNVWKIEYEGTPDGMVFNNGDGSQTEDATGISDGLIFYGQPNGEGKATVTNKGVWEGHNGVDGIPVDEADGPAIYYNLQGVRVANPEAGTLYIERRGIKTAKIIY